MDPELLPKNLVVLTVILGGEQLEKLEELTTSAIRPSLEMATVVFPATGMSNPSSRGKSPLFQGINMME